MVERFAALCRRAAAEPPSLAAEVRRRLLDVLGGEIGALPLAALADAPADVALPAAGMLAVLQYDAESLAILARFPPAAHEEILTVALRVVPRIAPATVLAHRRWIMELVDALLTFGLTDRLPPFLHSLQAAGHFEIVEAIRGSSAGRPLNAADAWLLDADAACWKGDYEALRRLLNERPAGGAAAAEAELLAAIARGVGGATDDALAALDALRAAAHTGHALRDIAGRWKAELLVRRGAVAAPPTRGGRTWRQALIGILRRRDDASAPAPDSQQALREASDHPVLRLVTWIALLRQPDDGRREVVRDFHEWVIAGLQREHVAGIEALAAEWRSGGGEATLWKMIALFGGNRGETCTVVDDGRLRALDLPTARQEAVAMQRRLRHLGLEATLRAFQQRAAEWPRLVVFRTYRAELLLWAGQYDAAAALFDEVRRTSVNRWAHVGLGAALALSGSPGEAERVWDEGLRVHRGALPGEATHVYRAEVAMAGGRLDEADGLLRRVLAAKPTRLRGRLLAAELAWLRGDADAGRAALIEAAATCPALADADGPLALAELLHDGGEDDRRDAAIARCRALRAALRGNSSSWLFTWYDPAGAMQAFAHAREQDLLLALERIERIGGRA